MIDGQINLRDAVNATISYTNEAGKIYQLKPNPAVLICRVRAPVVRESVLKEYPQMAQWLQPVFASLDAKTLQQLNASIAVEGLDAKKVAADYLKQKGWTK